MSVFKNNSIDEIIAELIAKSKKRFNESIDLDIKTGIDSTKQDQNMRGTLTLEHGIESPVRILVFAEGEDAKTAKAAGATTVGFLDLIEEIKVKGIGNYDVCLATPDLFMKLKDIARILGSSGLMPNKKDGTVTDELEGKIKNLKSGKNLLFRNDKQGHIRMRVAKINFEAGFIKNNINTIVNQLQIMKPQKVKQLFKKVYINTTQGPSIEIPLKLLNK